jgi:hypothetical protein
MPLSLCAAPPVPGSRPGPRPPSALPTLGGVLFGLSLVACGGKTDTGECDDSLTPSVQLQVTDAEANVLADAEVVYSHDGGAETPCENLDGVNWVCGFDLFGELVVTGSAPGFAPASKSYDVESDGCHAVTQMDVLRLSPAR